MSSRTYRTSLSVLLILLLGVTYVGKDLHHLFHHHQASENKCETATDHHFHKGAFDFHCQLCQIKGNEYQYPADGPSSLFLFAEQEPITKLVNLIETLDYESSIFLRGPPSYPYFF